MATVNDDKIELQVRRIISEEIGSYRETFEKHFRLVVSSISVILAIALAAFFISFTTQKMN